MSWAGHGLPAATVHPQNSSHDTHHVCLVHANGCAGAVRKNTGYDRCGLWGHPGCPAHLGREPPDARGGLPGAK
ncbi:hypothetical protein ACKKBG_A25345 [Auxenochlorella protothecoides x Auxenochlorella symbiontica]